MPHDSDSGEQVNISFQETGLTPGVLWHRIFEGALSRLQLALQTKRLVYGLC